MAYPGAILLEFGPEGIQQVDLSDSEPYALAREYLSGDGGRISGFLRAVEEDCEESG